MLEMGVIGGDGVLVVDGGIAALILLLLLKG